MPQVCAKHKISPESPVVWLLPYRDGTSCSSFKNAKHKQFQNFLLRFQVIEAMQSEAMTDVSKIHLLFIKPNSDYIAAQPSNRT
jgi:hypothetical protein